MCDNLIRLLPGLNMLLFLLLLFFNGQQMPAGLLQFCQPLLDYTPAETQLYI
jgi:hypothetical protein